MILISQIGKYLPGNVGHFVGRLALAQAHSLGRGRVVFAIGYETGWLVVAAMAVAVLGALAGGPDWASSMPQVPAPWFIGVVLGGVLILPFGGTWLINRWRPGPLRRLLGGGDLSVPSVAVAARCLLAYGVAVGLNGLMAFVLMGGLIDASGALLPAVIGGFALAWVLGFMVPGAPGGLGVREAVLLIVLGPLVGEGVAVAMTVLQRVVSVLADGVLFVLGLLLRKRVLR